MIQNAQRFDNVVYCVLWLDCTFVVIVKGFKLEIVTVQVTVDLFVSVGGGDKWFDL